LDIYDSYYIIASGSESCLEYFQILDFNKWIKKLNECLLIFLKKSTSKISCLPWGITQGHTWQ
jgi:hypothetical protein